MNKNINETKKELANKLKTKLNSPEYVFVPEIIKCENRHGEMLAFLCGAGLDGNIHKEENWISGRNINPGKGNEYKSKHMVCYNELEKEDWEEIVNLIEKRNKEKEQAFETRRKVIEQKLNQHSNLYYYWGRVRKEHQADVWIEDKGMRGFVTLLGGRGNGFTYHLYIAENHPVLDNFPFQTGFYTIETDRPIEKRTGRYNGYSSTGGESNPYNFTKFVEADDEITIILENGKKLVAKRVIIPTINQWQLENLSEPTPQNKNELSAVAKKETKPSNENQQLVQAIERLEQRIAELEKNGDNPQHIKALKNEVKVLESQKQKQNSNQQNQVEGNSTEISKPTSSQAENQNKNTGHVLLIVGGLLIVGAALIIGYLLGKDKKVDK